MQMSGTVDHVNSKFKSLIFNVLTLVLLLAATFSVHAQKVQLSVSGTVTDEKTEAPIRYSYIQIEDVVSGESYRETADEKGLFRFNLPDGEPMQTAVYELTFQRSGYLPHRYQIEVVYGEKDKQMKLNATLKKIDADRTVNELLGIDPLKFDRGNHDPDNAGKMALSELAQLLRESPDMYVEIVSHSDCSGDRHTNRRFTMKRSLALRDYLVEEEGIDEIRIFCHSFGEAKPLHDCGCSDVPGPDCTPEQAAENRRTVFRILRM